MEHLPFESDPVLIRAAGYPYDITRTSFVFRDGAAAPFDPALCEGRYPVIGYGSNQSPGRLLQKYGDDSTPIPVQRARLADHDVVYAAHFAAYGSIPAALRHVPGTTVEVAVTWLTEAQLDVMHPTEWDNYHYARLTGLSLALQDGGTLDTAYAYLSFRGHVARDDLPIALAEIAAENRQLPALRQIEALALMRDRLAPGTVLADFVHAHIADSGLRSARITHLAAAATAVAHAVHEVVPYPPKGR